MNMNLRQKAFRRLLVVGAVATLALATSAWAASTTSWAGMKTNLAAACDNEVLVQPFTAWGDLGVYTFAPNGGFEAGKTGWILKGASVVSGNEPFFVHGTSDAKSLSVPAGAYATSPAICVGADYPWSRLFANGPKGATLRVDLQFVDGSGKVGTITVGYVLGTGSWQLSDPMLSSSFLIAPYSKLGFVAADGQRYSAVAYTFTASGGTWRIDDLYVDPFKFK
jgi:hypothetical protein